MRHYPTIVFRRSVVPLVRRTAASLSVVFSTALFAASPTLQQIEFFEKNIRPVLVAECYECHSTAKTKAGLRLDYRDGLLKGGESGTAVVPGDAGKSLLIKTITHEHADLKMPKNGAKLDAGVVKHFVDWVNMGVPDPRTEMPVAEAGKATSWETVLASRKQWWSFQPVKPQPVPHVKNAAWSELTVDRFILAKLEEKKLSPAVQAEKRVLIRRLTFALTGLPPAPEEIEAFEKDASPDAFAKLTERLLASPRFGERWARHWMDLMRYAETHGSEGDPDIPMAWRYRDYLIRAFNADVPYDQLIREHLAGDLLPQPRWNREEKINESILGIANFRLVEHGFQPVDVLDDQVKAVENQIDVVSKAFQGLTVACARCHDHKFDAISQKDFYALYGILASSHPAQVTIDTPAFLNTNREELTKLKAQIKERLAEAWMKAAEGLPAKFLSPTEDAAEAKPRTAELRRQIGDLEAQARAAILQKQGKAAPDKNLPVPMASWSFDGDARDGQGALNGELLGGAKIENGRLILNGKDAALRSAPLAKAVREKTLEAWVALANTTQKGSGVISLETGRGEVFDAIVLGEKQTGKWICGSDHFNRTKDFEGPAETAAPGELVHLAAVYRADGRIEMYRNGVVYGAYTPSGDKGTLQTYPVGTSNVLIGQRHANRGMLAGEVEEARLYDRPLSAEEIKASFQAGAAGISREMMTKALTPEQAQQLASLAKDLEKELAREQAAGDSAGQVWKKMLGAAAGNKLHPLHAWAVLKDQPKETFAAAWQKLRGEVEADLAARKKFNEDNFRPAWDLLAGDYAKWFHAGTGVAERPSKPGEFFVTSAGSNAINGIYPAGVYTHLLSQKHNGVLVSPRFKVDSDYISVRALGNGFNAVRLIVENYPLGQNNIFPMAKPDQDTIVWVRLDTEYRKGCTAYLEIATYEDLTRQIPPGKGKDAAAYDGRSYIGAAEVVLHNGKDVPKETISPLTLLFAGEVPADAKALAEKYAQVLKTAIAGWSAGTLTDPQALWLDTFVRNGAVPNTVAEAGEKGVAEYRRLEQAVPRPRYAPGVMETVAFDQPVMNRGDHLKLGDAVPRRFLEAFGSQPYATKLSGRLELANDIASAINPLTARVMVNRIWHHLFGRGLVLTADNFGRLGEKPTHPELLDFLAGKFVEKNWSIKEMIRYLVATKTWQMSSDVSPAAQQVDPANEYLSHARLHRLEAEAIRDTLLAVSGELDLKMYGPSVRKAPMDEGRRSIYLLERRTAPHPFLEVFDRPKPSTTRGQRDATNLPAQSLTMMNDPFVIGLAKDWAERLVKDGSSDAEARVERMFEKALGRKPTAGERENAQQFLADTAKLHQQPAANVMTSEAVWADFAQAVFGLKEFIYVR